MLESMGNTVSIANNGLEAVSMSEQKNYDIIFMDCEMPLLDGYAASLRILSKKEFSAPIIIALTAHAMEGIEIKMPQCRHEKNADKTYFSRQVTKGTGRSQRRDSFGLKYVTVNKT